MQVLLIDSDSVLASTVAAFMTQQGMDVVVSNSAQDAILACDVKLPDVVVSDMALTGHSGIEFLHEFRSYHDWQNIPVVMWGMQQVSVPQQHALQQLGVAGILYKPKTTLHQLCSYLHALAPTVS